MSLGRFLRQNLFKEVLFLSKYRKHRPDLHWLQAGGSFATRIFYSSWGLEK